MRPHVAPLFGQAFGGEEYGLSIGFAGVDPTIMGVGPVPASRMALEKAGMKAQDIDYWEINEAFCIVAFNCIKELGLNMNLFYVESSFDAGKLTFFFTSEGRVDFRQLVKMLVKKFGVRIEMRQVGIRNQAKMSGGIGRCGREICCSAFIEKFGPVSIRMAKEQGLSLNPTKISGQCGRLMCCLTFEYEMYQMIRTQFPKIGKTVKTKNGKGEVIRHNAIVNRIAIRLDNDQDIEVGLDEIIKEY